MLEDGIATGVAEPIVDLLEAINIDMTDGRGVFGSCWQSRKCVVKGTPVFQPREMIVLGSIFGFSSTLVGCLSLRRQLLISLDIFGNVPLGSDEAGFAFAINEVLGARADMSDFPIGANDTKLRRIVTFIGNGIIENCACAETVLRMNAFKPDDVVFALLDAVHVL
jgi:hypothetical protein